MCREMWTDTQATSDFGGAAHPAPSPYSATDAYRFAASYSSAAPELACVKERAHPIIQSSTLTHSTLNEKSQNINGTVTRGSARLYRRSPG